MLPIKSLLVSFMIVVGFQVGISNALADSPPQPALKACEGKQEGDSCEFEKRNGKKETGTCKKTKKERLACMSDSKYKHHEQPKKKQSEGKPKAEPAPEKK